jgi:hypothetical protein
MPDLDKYKEIIESKPNQALAQYYRRLFKRMVDEKNLNKVEDFKAIIQLIKNEWMKRLDEDHDAGLPGEGLMSTMGYRVGDTQGVKKEYRNMIMIEVLRGPIPFVESPSYMREWGSDASMDRYNKLKRFLKSEINSPLQKNNYRAISEWTEDLNWLEKEGQMYVEK